MKYLIDTDWIIDHLNNVAKITQKLNEFTSEGMAISIISLAELYEGVYYSRDPVKSDRALEELLTPDLQILTIDKEICKIFGKERGAL